MANTNVGPNQNPILYARNTAGGAATYVTATNNKLDVNATASLAGSAIPISGATTAVGVAIVDSSGNQISSFGGGTQYANGSAQATPTGTVALGWDGTNVRALKTSSDGTQAVSVASLPLPTGAATAAKQPALGTAGSASADVITVQGIASMTALKVDGSGVTQPVSGTVTANAGTNLNTSALALETGGNLATIATAVSAIASPIPTKAMFLGVSDGTNLVAVRQGSNAFNSAAGGSINANNIAQFDDVSPTSITENNFGNLRISQNRNLYTTIRDAAGNERGVNVTSGNALTVDGSASTQPVSQSGTWTVQPGNTANTTPWLATPAASATTVGLTIKSDPVGLGTTVTSVKASAGMLYGYHIYNPNSVVAWIQFFNLATGSVTLGTTTPFMFLAIPPGGWADTLGAVPIAYSTAISIATTTTSHGSTALGLTVPYNIWYA